MLAAPRMNSPLNRKIEAAIRERERAQRIASHKQRLESMTLEEARRTARLEIARLAEEIAGKEYELERLRRITSIPPLMDSIFREVCRHYGLSKAELMSVRRRRLVCIARQVAMYLCRNLTRQSFPEIGRRMGGRDHTTIIHGVHRIERLLPFDGEIREAVRVLTVKLVGPAGDDFFGTPGGADGPH